MQEIICILDKSGSMASCADDAIGGFRQFIKDQQKIGDCNLTVVWFDNSYDLSYEGLLSKYNPPIHWPIGGMTALFDAIGKTFNHVNPRFAKEKPEKVILAILTDGLENYSKEFHINTIRDLIIHHQEKYNWNIIYLGANQNAWDEAGKIGINIKNAYNFDTSNMSDTFSLYSRTVASYRT